MCCLLFGSSCTTDLATLPCVGGARARRGCAALVAGWVGVDEAFSGISGANSPPYAGQSRHVGLPRHTTSTPSSASHEKCVSFWLFSTSPSIATPAILVCNRSVAPLMVVRLVWRRQRRLQACSELSHLPATRATFAQVQRARMVLQRRLHQRLSECNGLNAPLFQSSIHGRHDIRCKSRGRFV